MRKVTTLLAVALVLAGGSPAAAQELTLGGGLRGHGQTVRGYWATASLQPVARSCLAGAVQITGSRWAEPTQETALLGGVTCQATGRRLVRPFLTALAGVANDPRPEVQGLLGRFDWSVGVDVRVDTATWIRAAAGLRSLLHPDLGPGAIWSLGLVRTLPVWR